MDRGKDESANTGQPSAGNIPDALELTGVHLTAYKTIVRPNQVVKLEAYFLERWVRLLGPSAAWMVVAFRQEAYRNKALGAWVKVGGRQIADWVSLNPDTFWRHMREPGLLAWFVERDNAKPVVWVKGADGKPHRDINRYRVLEDTPLTPADQAHLRKWLTAHAPTPDAQGMIAALGQALQTDRKELLAADPAAPAPKEKKPLSIQTIARQALPQATVSGEFLEFFASLCDDLHEHLIPGNADLVFVTHYFIREWLAQLGHDLAWVIVYLQDKVFLDEAQGLQRNSFWVEGGVRRLADLVGITQSKTVGRWLAGPGASAEEAGKPDRPALVAQFVTVLERRKGRDKTDPQRMDLQVRARPATRVPLTHADHLKWSEMLKSAGENGAPMAPEGEGVYPTHRDGGEGVHPTHKGGGEGVHPTHSAEGKGVDPTHKDPGQGVHPTHRDGGEGAQPSHRGRGEGVYPRDEGGRSGRLSESPSYLNSLPEKTSAPLHPQAPAAAPDGAGEAGVVPLEKWGDLKALTQEGQIPPKGNITRRKLLAAAPAPEKYVAWYLAGLTQATIKFPAIWAAGKCIEADDDETAPALFTQLAQRGPQAVAALLRWTGRWPQVTGWDLADAALRAPAQEFIQACGELAAGWKAEKEHYATLISRAQRGIRELALAERVKALEAAAVLNKTAAEAKTLDQTDAEPPALDPVLDASYDSERTLRQVWAQVLEQVRLEMNKSAFNAHVRDTQLIAHEAGVFTIGVPNENTLAWLENRLLSTFRRTLGSVVGRKVELRFQARR